MPRVGKLYIDELTGLFNRRYLLKRAREELQTAGSIEAPLAFVIIDLDHFKNINDTYGHALGDEVLKAFGAFLTTLLREGDIVFRYGGDEFVVLLHNTSLPLAHRIADRIIRKCRDSEFARVSVTCSIGVSSFPSDGGEWPRLFEVADRNLYSAKRHGRDRVGVFETEVKRLTIPTKEILGRDSAIERIRDSLAPVSTGMGGAVCMSGEVGVGKTRLVQEVARDPDFAGFRLLQSNLSPTTQSIPYYPFREIIRAAAAEGGGEEIAALPPGYRTELVKILPEFSDESDPVLGQTPVVDKFRLFEAVKRFIEVQARKRPHFLFIDNLHWADAGSLDLVPYLVRSLSHTPVFFFFTYRVEEVTNTTFQDMLRLMVRDGLMHSLDLELLDVPATARMLSSILDSPPSADLVRYVFAETGGNPFFIEELVKSLETAGALIWSAGGWAFDLDRELGIPSSVGAVVDRKLAMLGGQERRILECAAVIGREFDPALLRAVAKINEGHLFDVMDRLLAPRLLRTRDLEHYYFPQDLIRGIIYRRIAPPRLRRYHLAIGEALLTVSEGRGDVIVEEIANHFYVGGDRAKAVKYNTIAGDRARDSYANRDAIGFYTRVIECLGDDASKESTTQTIASLMRRAAVLDLLGEGDAAGKDLDAAFRKAQELGDRKAEADCLLESCRSYLAMARYRDVLDRATAALGIYRELNERKGEANCFNRIGTAHWYLGQYQSAMVFYRNSLRIGRELGDRQLEAMLLGNIAIIHWNLGEYRKAFRYYRRCLGLAERIGDVQIQARGFNNIGLICADLGEHKKALGYYERALETTRSTGDRKVEASTLNNLGVVYAWLGEYAKALEHYEHSLTITEEIADRKVQAMSLNNMGIAYTYVGKYSKAVDHCTRSLQISREIDDRRTQTEALLAIGDVFLETNRLKDAERHYLDASSIAEDTNSKPILAEACFGLALLHLEADRAGQAKDCLTRALTLAQEVDSDKLRGKALCLSGRLHAREGDWDRARSSFAEAIAILKRTGSKLELGKSCYYQGLMLWKSGENDPAVLSLTKALEVFQGLGAKAWIGRCRLGLRGSETSEDS